MPVVTPCSMPASMLTVKAVSLASQHANHTLRALTVDPLLQLGIILTLGWRQRPQLTQFQ